MNEITVNNLGVVVNDIKYYSVLDLSKILGKSRNFIKNAISHLNLNGTVVYNIKARKEVISYTEDCLDKIKELISITNKDPRYLNKQTNLKKYGTECPFQNKDIQNKCVETCKQRYGVSNYNQTNESQIRKEITCMKKYGVKNPSQSDEIKEKIKEHNLKKFGVCNVSQKDEIKNKRKETIQRKFGVDYASQNENIKNKIKETNLNVYGSECVFSNKIIKDKIKKSQLKKLNDAKNKNLITISELAKKFNRDESTIIDDIRLLNLQIIKFEKDMRFYLEDKNLSILSDYFSITDDCGVSYLEKELVDFIKSIYSDEIIENDRKIIYPKELDVYIPKMKVAIEFDGLFWHDENHVDKNYHLNKTCACNEKNIDLIHVFEDDWIERKAIVKSMIASRLGIYKEKIFARNCQIKEIEKTQSKIFFNENHLQGFTNGDLYLGLIFNNELVQCICVNKKGWHDGNVELTRMATKLNTQVIGGFSRLMKHISDHIKYDSITSYVYTAWFNGKGYVESGFEKIKENKPSYSYIMNGKRIHKSKFRKDKIKKMFESGELKYYDDFKTEHENMLKNKIYRIYDCGTVKMKYEI